MRKVEIYYSRRVKPYIRIIKGMRNDVLQDIFPDDGRQEVVDEHPLVMKSDFALNALKSRSYRSGVLRNQFIMKPVHEPLKLRNDDVLVISWVADDGAPRVVDVFGLRRIRRLTPRQVSRIRIAGCAGERPTLNKSIVASVEVRRIVRTLAIDAVKIKTRRAKVDQTVRIVLLLQAACRIERQIVVDELAEIRISRGNAALFGVRCILRRFGVGDHRFAKLQQVLLGLGIAVAQIGG